MNKIKVICLIAFFCVTVSGQQNQEPRKNDVSQPNPCAKRFSMQIVTPPKNYDAKLVVEPEVDSRMPLIDPCSQTTAKSFVNKQSQRKTKLVPTSLKSKKIVKGR